MRRAVPAMAPMLEVNASDDGRFRNEKALLFRLKENDKRLRQIE
jgi:hypothetical protein